jgi:mannosyltransferase OCH1-like enzyme
MSDNIEDTNKRMKAFFIARPQDPYDAEKDRLRLLRADPEKYKEVYRIPLTIPKIAFSFWEGNQFTYLHYLTIASFSKYNPDFKIIIYTTNTINNVLVLWNTGEQSKRYENLYDINKLKDIPNVSFHYIDINHELQYSGVLSNVWKSDIIRIMKLYDHGGIYIDFDTLFIKKIDERLLNIDKDIAFNTYYGIINNAFIVSKPRNNTIKYILDNISNKLKAGDVSLTYMQFGPTLITQLIKNTSYESNIYYIPNEMTCPYLCDQMNLLFNSNVDLIKEDTFCIHWYNGDTHSRNYCSTFDVNNIKKDDCIFNKLLIDLLSN